MWAHDIIINFTGTLKGFLLTEILASSLGKCTSINGYVGTGI